jgi:two-component system, chemotaxis family, protein-glutamate methylesterase/glutaminase
MHHTGTNVMAIDDHTLSVAAVGASAGGVEALKNFAQNLPPDLPYAVLVVLHMPFGAPSVLGQILARNAPLPTNAAVDGERLQPGTIRVSVPNRHLIVDGDRIALSESPTENGHRPAINTLFRSVATAFGRRAVGILLSGVLDDGTLGLAAIRSHGGTTIAQSPTDALFPTMPLNAIEAGVVDHESSATDLGRLLAELASDPTPELENRIAMAPRFATDLDAGLPGPLSGLACPACHRSVRAVSGDDYRCRVGHVWTAAALLGTHDTGVDNARSLAIRSLQEKARLSRRLAEQELRHRASGACAEQRAAHG